MRIIIPDAIDRPLALHLREPGEQLAFLGTEQDGDGLRAVHLLTAGPELLDDSDAWHVALTDAGRQSVLRWAGERHVGLAEVHTHAPYSPAEFSWTDVDGLKLWAPNVVWRLGGRPYAALVLAGDSIDALVWTDGDALPGVPEFVERSTRPVVPTGRSLIRLVGKVAQ